MAGSMYKIWFSGNPAGRFTKGLMGCSASEPVRYSLISGGSLQSALRFDVYGQSRSKSEKFSTSGAAGRMLRTYSADLNA